MASNPVDGQSLHRIVPAPLSRPYGAAERVARLMIARHGSDAARAAIAQLNSRIDRGDVAGRDLWACVVHLIHERQHGVAPSAAA